MDAVGSWQIARREHVALLDEPERRRQYGDRRRKRVERRFGRERVLDTMESRYRVIVDGDLPAIGDDATAEASHTD